MTVYIKICFQIFFNPEEVLFKKWVSNCLKAFFLNVRVSVLHETSTLVLLPLLVKINSINPIMLIIPKWKSEIFYFILPLLQKRIVSVCHS